MLRLAAAADGLLARVRLPGGLVSAQQLQVLARLADEIGDGRAELTSRGNVQLRGLTADAATLLTSELIGAGLLPSLSHDRVRNVLASPLAGLDRGPDLTGIVRALDAGLCARPRLAELPGRFLFAVDDGRGDVAGPGADVVATVRPDGAVVNGLFVRQAYPGWPERAAPDGRPTELSRGSASRPRCSRRSPCRGVPWPEGGARRHRLASRRPARWRAERGRPVAARLGLVAATEEPGTHGAGCRGESRRPVGLVAREETGGGAGSRTRSGSS